MEDVYGNYIAYKPEGPPTGPVCEAFEQLIRYRDAAGSLETIKSGVFAGFPRSPRQKADIEFLEKTTPEQVQGWMRVLGFFDPALTVDRVSSRGVGENAEEKEEDLIYRAYERYPHILSDKVLREKFLVVPVDYKGNYVAPAGFVKARELSFVSGARRFLDQQTWHLTPAARRGTEMPEDFDPKVHQVNDRVCGQNPPSHAFLMLDGAAHKRFHDYWNTLQTFEWEITALYHAMEKYLTRRNKNLSLDGRMEVKDALSWEPKQRKLHGRISRYGHGRSLKYMLHKALGTDFVLEGIRGIGADRANFVISANPETEMGRHFDGWLNTIPNKPDLPEIYGLKPQAPHYAQYHEPGDIHMLKYLGHSLLIYRLPSNISTVTAPQGYGPDRS